MKLTSNEKSFLFSSTDIPDISFGWGCEPLENDLDNTVMKLDETQRQNQILLAKSEKETGNNFMKTNSLPEAIKHYTYSIIFEVTWHL